MVRGHRAVGSSNMELMDYPGVVVVGADNTEDYNYNSAGHSYPEDWGLCCFPGSVLEAGRSMDFVVDRSHTGAAEHSTDSL